MIAPCLSCGQMVVMARVRGTSVARAMSPLPVEGPYWTLDAYGYAQPLGAYVEHGCPVGVIEQFRSTWLGRANLQNELNAAAMAAKCPKCGAEPGEQCENLMERARGRSKPTQAPHQERYPLNIDTEGTA